MQGDLLPSRTSIISWPSITKPPKHYWSLWSHFTYKVLTPILERTQVQWEECTSYRFTPGFYKYKNSFNLYQLVNDTLSEFHLMRGARSRFQASYNHVPYQCRVSINEDEFFPVDVQYTKKGISIVGIFFLRPTPSAMPTSEPSLQQRFLSLHPSLQRIFGQVKSPTDIRKEMLDRIISSNNNVFGASDASLKHDRASHAWIISSGDCSDIENPNIHISGSGPVYGYYPNLPPHEANSRGSQPLLSFLNCYEIITSHTQQQL